MSQYKRSTRECAFEDLQPDLRQAMHAYLLQRNLAEVETQIEMCCETVSERQKPGVRLPFFGDHSDQVYHTGMFLTPDWLVWAHSGDQTGTKVMSAHLSLIHVRPYTSLVMNDTGLEVAGYMAGSNAAIRGYLGLGEEAAAQKFCDLVKKATDKANPHRSLLDVFRGKNA
jgi:hypothetical protein